MSSIRITTVQTAIEWDNIDYNLSKYETLLADVESDLIILPEMFTTGFLTNPQEKHKQEWKTALTWMKNLARKKKTAICGSLINFRRNKWFNSMFFVSPPYFFVYDKRHLFRIGDEYKVYTPGRKNITIEYKGFKIRPQICYDLRFSAWNRNSYDADKDIYDYDILIFVANWPEVRIKHWESLLIARAIENLSYVVGVNRIGTSPDGIKYNGNTLIIAPDGEIIHKAPNDEEEVFTCELSMEKLKDTRKQFPFAQDWDKFVFVKT